MSRQSNLAIKAIEQLFSSQSQVQPVQNTDLAQYILAHVNDGASKTLSTSIAAAQGAESEKPSFLSHLFDAMSSGLYATSGITSDLIKAVKDAPENNPSGNPLKSIEQGIEAGASSIGRNVLGAITRSTGETAQAVSQATGLDEIPIIGKPVQKVESGLTGLADKVAPRHTSSQTLGELGVKNPYVKFGGGFAADVISDPITYVPGLDIISTIKKAREVKLGLQGFNPEHVATTANAALDNAAAGVPSVDVFKKPATPSISPIDEVARTPAAEMSVGKSMIPAEVPPPVATPSISNKPGLIQSILGQPAGQDLTDLKALRASDNAKRAANVRWGKPIDWHDIPEMTPEEKAAWADMGRQGKMAKKGIVSDGKGNISVQAGTNVIQDIKNGIIPRFGPQPPAAEGLAAERAIEVANKRIENLDKPSRKGFSNKVLTPIDQTNMLSSLNNEAKKLVNEQFAAKPKKVLNPKQQAAFDSVKAWAEDTGKKLDKSAVEKELAAQVARKTINKTDAKAISKEFFPPEPIRNFASTPLGRRMANDLSLRMLRNAEDHAISQGVRPIHWNGMQMRLSEVLADVNAPDSVKFSKEIMDAVINKNPKKITDPAVQEAVTKALARRSLSMSDLLSDLSKHTLDAKSAVADSVPYNNAKELFDKMPQAAKEAVMARGATNAEGNSIKDHIYNIIHSTDTPVETAMRTNSKIMAEATVAGKVSISANDAVNEAINKTLEMTPKQLATNVTGRKMVDGIMTKWSTIYGRQAELKRFTQSQFLHGELNAIHRTKFLRGLKQLYSEEQLSKGFRYAILPGKLAEAAANDADVKVGEAAQIFTKYFEFMLGKDYAVDSVAARSQVEMDLVNKHLKAIKSDFRFTNGRKVIVNGIDRNYSPKGVGWVRSWETADPKNPISVLHDIDLAMQRAIAENSFYDEAARNFGAKTTDAWHNPEIHKWTIPNVPRLEGVQFHPEIRNQIMRLMHDLEQGAWSPKSSAMRNIVMATRVWKSSVTIYFPPHHINNLIGDATNTWYAGYNDPTIYRKAWSVLMSQKPKFQEALKPDFSKVSPLEAMDKLKGMMDSRTARIFEPNPEVRSGKIILTNKKTGLKLDAHQLWTSGDSRGLFLTYNKIEDTFGQTPMGAIFKNTPEDSVLRNLAQPFGGRAHHVATTISEYREHYVRLAHYIGAVDKYLTKYGSKDMNKVFDDAAYEVRKWHPDGSDMTQFEQKARVAIPFYSWTRKEIPLLLQTMVTRPAKIVAYPRAERAIAGMSGIDVNEDKGFLDPYPDNQLFPDWIRATGIGPIGDPQSNSAVARFWSMFGATTTGPSGDPMGYTEIAPHSPFGDTALQLFGSGQSPQNTLQGMLNSLNPGIQIPGQLAFNQTFSGAPITKDQGGAGLGAYILSQIPQSSAFTRATGIGKKQNPDTNNQELQNLLNMIFSPNIRGTGPYITSAEFEAKARAKNARSK
jgi:hypothetical protein